MKHYIDPRIVSPRKEVVICLAGCGGTGSQVLNGLARINHALKALGHQGLHVIAFDPDTVSEANIGRQAFSPADVGQNKAVVLVTRINQFMGLDWDAMPISFEQYQGGHDGRSYILISAVDSAAARLSIVKKLKRGAFSYWLDIGNTKNTGQVVLGSIGKVKQPPGDKNAVEKLPCITEICDLPSVREEDSGPSCSLAAALLHQDLMVNQIVASWALQILWQCFRQGVIEYHGCFVTLENIRVNPLPVDPAVWERLSGRKGRSKNEKKISRIRRVRRIDR